MTASGATMPARSPRPPLIRTALYASASSIAMFDAAIAARPDAVIVDLEDGTPADERAMSRLVLASLVDRCRRAGVVPVVRVNGVTTDDFEPDLHAVRVATPDVVLLPKADPGAVRHLHSRLAGTTTEVWALIETVRAVLAVGDVLDAAPVAAAVIGYGDLCKELGLPLATDHPELAGVRSLVLAATTRLGLAALDGVVLDRDPQVVEAACRASFVAGFQGRTLYHPRHVEPCRAAAAHATG